MSDNKPTTFIEQAIARATEEARGRWAKEAPTFPGANVYPKQPETSPWSQGGAVPPEAPLGIDVNFVAPVGEKFELEQGSPPSLPPTRVTEDTVQDAPVAFPASERPASNQKDIPDDYVGERRSDGVPIGNPLGLRRRA
jgi:hypothetical protein